MAEYIEREAAIAKCREIVACEWNHRASPVSWADAYEQFAEDIEELQSADVAPVRHGRWVDKQLIKSFKHTNIPVVECSACGIDFCDIINNHYFLSQHCPHCGAKMYGGAD